MITAFTLKGEPGEPGPKGVVGPLGPRGEPVSEESQSALVIQNIFYTLWQNKK